MWVSSTVGLAVKIRIWKRLIAELLIKTRGPVTRTAVRGRAMGLRTISMKRGLEMDNRWR